MRHVVSPIRAYTYDHMTSDIARIAMLHARYAWYGMSTSLSQTILVGIILVGRLGVLTCYASYGMSPPAGIWRCRAAAWRQELWAPGFIAACSTIRVSALMVGTLMLLTNTLITGELFFGNTETPLTTFGQQGGSSYHHASSSYMSVWFPSCLRCLVLKFTAASNANARAMPSRASSPRSSGRRERDRYAQTIASPFDA